MDVHQVIIANFYDNNFGISHRSRLRHNMPTRVVINNKSFTKAGSLLGILQLHWGQLYYWTIKRNFFVYRTQTCLSSPLIHGISFWPCYTRSKKWGDIAGKRMFTWVSVVISHHLDNQREMRHFSCIVQEDTKIAQRIHLAAKCGVMDGKEAAMAS